MAGQINLYDPALKRQRDWLTLGNVVGLAAVLAVAVAALGYVARLDVAPLASRAEASKTQLAELRTQIATLEAQVATRKPDPRLAEELAARRALLDLRGEVLKTLRHSVGDEKRVAHAEYLRGLARQSVNGLWLMEFKLTGADDGVEIRGRTVDPALLPEYIRRLNGEAAFQGRAFASLKIDSPPPAPADTAAPRRFHEFVLVPVTAPATQTTAAVAVTGGPG